MFHVLNGTAMEESVLGRVNLPFFTVAGGEKEKGGRNENYINNYCGSPTKNRDSPLGNSSGKAPTFRVGRNGSDVYEFARGKNEPGALQGLRPFRLLALEEDDGSLLLKTSRGGSGGLTTSLEIARGPTPNL